MVPRSQPAGKGAGPGGGSYQGGRGGGHQNEPPSYKTGSGRYYVKPPPNGIGHPEGKEWTDEEWKRAWTDSQVWEDQRQSMLATYGGSPLESAHALCVPIDTQRKKPVTPIIFEKASSEHHGYPNTACAYCLRTPKAAAGSPEEEPSHPNNWKFGVGQGNHNPYTCKPSIRNQLEVVPVKFPAAAEHVRRAVHLQSVEAYENYLASRKSSGKGRGKGN